MAILGVLAFHAFPQQVTSGFVGVDVFFVISGYVVSLSLIARAPAHDGASVAAFYARRVRRLFPALVALLIATAIAGYWLLSTAQLAMLGKHILSSAGFVQNLVLWQEAGYFDAASHEKWLLHLWSLGIEEQFYLLLPLLFLWRGKLSSREGSSALSMLIALLALASIALCFWQSRHAPSAGFYWPLGRFWEFLLGVGLASWHAKRPYRLELGRAPLAQMAAFVAFTGLLAACLLMSEQAWKGWHFPGPQVLWPTLVSFVLLSTPQSLVNRRVLAHPIMRYLGLISYPLYLWHWPVLAYLNALDPEHLLPWTRWLGLLLAIALAALTFHLIERPAQRIASRHPALLTKGLIAAMLGVSLLGWLLWTASPKSGLDRHAHDLAQMKRWDEPALYRDSLCLSNSAVNPWKRDDFFCRGNPDTAEWAILGDSHANALAAGLMKAMPDQWVNLGGGGCMPFGGVDSGSDALGVQCPREIPEAFLRHVAQAPNIRGILIDVRGAFYVNGTDVGAQAPAQRRWLREVAGPTSSPTFDASTNAAIFRFGVQRTLRSLGSTGKQLVWVLGTPELGADVNTCLNPLPGQNWLGVTTACAITLETHRARHAAYSAIVRSEIERWNSHRPAGTSPVKVLDPADVLCVNGRCPVVLDGIPLYRDGDHLSIQGSDLVAGWLLPQLPSLPDRSLKSLVLPNSK